MPSLQVDLFQMYKAISPSCLADQIWLRCIKPFIGKEGKKFGKQSYLWPRCIGTILVEICKSNI